MDTSFFCAVVRFLTSDAYSYFIILAVWLMVFFQCGKFPFCFYFSHPIQPPLRGLEPYFGLVRSPLARPRVFFCALAFRITNQLAQISRDMYQSPFWFGLVWGSPLSSPSLLSGLLSPTFLTRHYFMLVALEPLLAPRGQGFDYVLFTGALGTGYHQRSHPQLFLGFFVYYRHWWRYLVLFSGFVQGARLYYISSFRLVYGAPDLWLRRLEWVAASDRKGVSGLP
jgi:hypothetical protein